MSAPDAKNVRKVLRAASHDDWVNGVNWYVIAHHEAVKLTEEFEGLTVRQAAGIIAALSPRVSWTLNLKNARTLIRTGTVPGLRGNVAKAEKILGGFEPLDVLGGKKVRAFFDAIVDPLFSEAVVVDRHAADVAIGEVGDDKSRQRLLEVKGGYDAVADCYRKVARDLGLLPHQVQAVTWEAWRRLKGEGTL